jgi:glycerol-3-phosphate O-acyltransferase / dihydroxyacetone phosphate acyltransferase
MRRLLDRVLYAVAWFASQGFFRDVEVRGRHHVPSRGVPCLVVANHFNGFVDPLLVARGIGRLPRFLAKATLWKVTPARPLYALAGMVPVYRRVDAAASGSEATDTGNRSTFHRAHEVLAKGQLVAIFPEGTTHDEPRLAEMRTGAARIALGAAAAGIRGLQILPVGVVTEDKLETRSRGLVQVGAPIDLDRELDEARRPLDTGEDDREAVRALTGRITDELRAITPDFESGREHGALTLAAEIVARTPGRDVKGEVGLGTREHLAKRFGRLTADERADVRAAVADYQLDLALAGVRDSEVVAGLDVRHVVMRLLRTAVVLLVLAPLALVGIVVNLLPAVLVVVAGQRPEAPVSKGTTRVLVGLVVFPATWWAVAFATTDGWLRVSAAMAVLAVCGLVAAAWADIASWSLRDLRAWRAIRNRRGLLAPVRQHRAQLVERLERLVADA